jgi:hypothetical protein
MGKTSDRYKDRCDEKRVSNRWPFEDPHEKLRKHRAHTERMNGKKKDS